MLFCFDIISLYLKNFFSLGVHVQESHHKTTHWYATCWNNGKENNGALQIHQEAVYSKRHGGHSQRSAQGDPEQFTVRHPYGRRQ